MNRTEHASLKAQHNGAILLIPWGALYGAFCEDAPIVAKRFDLVLGMNTATFCPATGFPAAELEKNVAILERAGHRVVVIQTAKELAQ